MSFYLKKTEENEDKKTNLSTTTTDNLKSNDNDSETGCCGCGGCCGSLCRRLKAELSHPTFSPMDITGHILDPTRTFGPTGHLILVLKTLFMAWSCSILVMGFLPSEDLVLEQTYWANSLLLLSTIYFALSWYASAHSNINNNNCQSCKTTSKATEEDESDEEEEETTTANKTTEITFIHKIMWAIYAIVAPGEIVVTLGYWGMDLLDWHSGNQSHVIAFFQSHTAYEIVTGEQGADAMEAEQEEDGTNHHGYGRDYLVLACYYVSVYGGILLMLLWEGLVVNRIPLRVRHFGLLILYMIVGLMYTIARIIYYEIRGDPNQIEDDENTYGVFKWDQNPLYVLLVPFFFVLAPPTSFLIVYWLSLPARRYSHSLTDDMTVVMAYSEI